MVEEILMFWKSAHLSAYLKYILGCVKQSVSDRLREVILTLSPGETHLDCWVQC